MFSVIQLKLIHVKCSSIEILLCNHAIIHIFFSLVSLLNLLTSHIQLRNYPFKNINFIKNPTTSIVSHSVNDFTAAVTEIILMHGLYILHTHIECLGIFRMQVVA